MQDVIANEKNLTVYEAEVIDLIVKDNVIMGVETEEGEKIFAKTATIKIMLVCLNGLKCSCSIFFFGIDKKILPSV